MDRVYGYDNIGRPWWGEHEGESLTEEQLSKSAWYGHFKFGLHERLEAVNEMIRYITILREPANRILSEYHRNDYRGRLGWTPVQLAESRYNEQVRMLSGRSYNEKPTGSDVGRALENLRRHFVYVALFEHYARLETFVKSVLHWEFDFIPHENRGGKKATATEAEIDELRVCEALELDYALYNYVKQVTNG
jgi:hypothetical protein